ncbi:MAG: response regulator transcription factor, partial [Ruminococcaceae bacterium]|nr:response regulator transcription factor [Oscillospiraceae bacterium]
MKKALIIDDDPNISELLRLYFDKDGFAVITCLDGEKAYETFLQTSPDVVILDLMLPGRDGYDIMREIRRGSDVPILMLTARSDTLDKVVGLELGADDYIQKPFEPKELVARVKAVLRRVDSGAEQKRPVGSGDAAGELAVFPGLSVDKSRYSVSVNDQQIDMPPKELELLFFLATHP